MTFQPGGNLTRSNTELFTGAQTELGMSISIQKIQERALYKHTTIFNIESHKNKTIGPFHGPWKFICGNLRLILFLYQKIKNIENSILLKN